MFKKAEKIQLFAFYVLYSMFSLQFQFVSFFHSQDPGPHHRRSRQYGRRVKYLCAVRWIQIEKKENTHPGGKA